MENNAQRYDTLASPSNLTRSQLLFWVGQQLNPDAPLYNMALAFHISGKIYPDHFQNAFQRVVDDSDVLRTIFNDDAGVPLQNVVPKLSYQVTFLDWSGDHRAKSAFADWALKRTQQSFNLSVCLFDCVLIKISDEHFVWYFNQHHLVTDAWSVSVLYKAVSKAYQVLVEDSATPERSIHPFKKFIEHEHRNRTNDVNVYWQKRSKELPVPPSLYGRSESFNATRSERISLALGAERSAQLRRIAAQPDVRSWTEDLSLFNIFATILFSYLHRVSGQADLAIGCPAHNRATAEFKETPGLFIEILPLITTIDPADTFTTLLKKVRGDTNDFLRYAQAGASAPELSRGFNVILNYIHAAFGKFAGLPASAEWIHSGHCDPRHHLRLQIHDFDSSGNIQLHFDLNCEVFNESLRTRVPNHFLNLLDAFIVDRNQNLGKPSILTQDEFELLGINPFSTTKVAAHHVLQLIDKQVVQNGSRAAMRFKHDIFDYEYLESWSNRVANFLIERGVGKGQRIGIFLKRSPELITSILAVWKTGAAYVPVAVDYPAERIRHILRDAGVTLVLTQSELSANIADLDIESVCLSEEKHRIKEYPETHPQILVQPQSTAYVMFTSGSTGNPKGVIISHVALANYIEWAASYYQIPEHPSMPLFTSIGFDLTVTSMFLPLVLGGTIVIYEEDQAGPDLSLLQVVDENAVDILKLTPAHLLLLKDRVVSDQRLKTMIVGGDDLKRGLAESIWTSYNKDLFLYNEYGPTEATVGCVVHKFNPDAETGRSVPIGTPISNMQAYVLDAFLNLVPRGVTGELYVAGIGLADGYWNQDELTRERFVSNPFQEGSLMYRTGDLARMNDGDELEYLGRVDQQLKIGGIRVEPAEIESAIAAHPMIRECVVVLQQRKIMAPASQEKNCTRCGLTSRYPQVEFDQHGVCNLCRAYDTYEQKAKQYFKTMDDLRNLFLSAKGVEKREYDCLVLLSGGKDSTYVLARLAEMGLNVLAFTLDNGYISDGAKENIRKVVEALGVDHMYGRTSAMNAIFVDSLKRHHNVCDGCFKTIYTLSTQVALEKRIPFIVTGLSRGQFFETRLTEELFRTRNIDNAAIDKTILDARKAYHRVDDAVRQHLDVSIFEKDDVFEKVQFVDFYRYCDVSLDEMLTYLNRRLPWVRPSDTGRSTNCLINKVGIFIHKKEKGYSNYAFPYSWDVRVGHKVRDAALAEIEEEINEKEVRQILDEIGYSDTSGDRHDERQLVAYYEADVDVSSESIVAFLSQRLPHYMIPVKFLRMESLPRTPNGKLDRKALALREPENPVATSYEAPRNEIEELLAKLWGEVLYIDRVGIHDNFLSLGGYSLAAIRLMSRINETFDLQLPVTKIFEYPTVSGLASFLERTISVMLDELDRANDNSGP